MWYGFVYFGQYKQQGNNLNKHQIYNSVTLSNIHVSVCIFIYNPDCVQRTTFVSGFVLYEHVLVVAYVCNSLGYLIKIYTTKTQKGELKPWKQCCYVLC